MADDKGIYPFVPAIIRYYLREEPILANVETFRAAIPPRSSTSWPTSTSWWSRRSTARAATGCSSARPRQGEQREEFARKIEANPKGYIGQPTIALSQHPTYVDGRLEGRHVDLRPFILYGEEIKVLAGGLTRVALPRGSLVVNSSQGGGTKDTWVLRGAPPSPAAIRPDPATSKSEGGA